MDDVFQEILELHEEYGVQCFTFNDGSFEDPGKLGKQRVESLSKQIVEYPDRMSFRCFFKSGNLSGEGCTSDTIDAQSWVYTSHHWI